MQSENAEVTYDQVFQVFKREVNSEPVPQGLVECLKTASSYEYEIDQAKRSGTKCRNQADWIGLER